MRKLLSIILAALVLLSPITVLAQMTTVQGGTGTSSPSGILYGIMGNLHLQTVGIGSGLTFTGGLLSATGGGGTPGGLNLQVQYNNAGAFGGISGAVTNGTILNLTNPLIGGATLTTSSVNGVSLTTGGSATTFLNGAGSYTTPAGGGGSAYPFTPATNFGVAASATTTAIWAQNALFASSTTSFPTLAVSQAGTGPAAIFTGGNVAIGTTSPGTANNLAIGGAVGGGAWARFCRDDVSFFCTYLTSNNGAFNFQNTGTSFFSWSNGGTYNANTGNISGTNTQAMVLRGNTLIVGTSTNNSISGGHLNIWGANGFNNYLSVTNADTGTGTFGDVFQITSAGRIGIGSSTPAASLSVQNNAYFAGNIGIGTSSPAFPLSVVYNTGGASPGEWVENLGSAAGNFNYVSHRTNAGNLGNFHFDGYDTNGAFNEFALFSGGATSLTAGGVGGYLAFSTVNNGGADTEHMRIDSTGNVGIGSTTPGSLLSLGTTGGINFSATATSTFGSSANGINLTNGCFAVAGVCITGGTTGNTFGYPFVGNATTTSLTFGGNQVFTNTPTFSFLGAGTVNSTAAGTIYNTATSTPTVAGPITYSGTLGSFIGGVSGAFNCVVATGSVSGCLSSTDWTTFNNKQPAGNYITALTGDGTASGPGSVPFTLATVNSNIGTFNNVTVNGKGLVTAASNIAYDTFGWPFTPVSYGVSTSTTLGLLNGFLSTASSTVNANFFLPQLATSAGSFLAVNSLGQVIATSTPGGSSLTGTAGQVAYFNATNTAIGTSTLFFSPKQWVGIGTTSPQNPVDIETSETITSGSSEGTGGTITHANGFTIHTFTGSGTFVAPLSTTSVEYLIIAGGGGGGSGIGSGGGAGGDLSSAVSGNSTITPGGSFPIVVGGGGPGSSNTTLNGTNGSASTFNSLSATGGGAGTGQSVSASSGQAGGSGGGGSRNNTSGGTGTAGQGNNGGSGNNTANFGAGGGGGASAVGGGGLTTGGGAGGAGLANSITGSSVTYAGGGGGSVQATSGAGVGGSGGGGAGANTSPGTACVAGTNGLGGGGGGGATNGDTNVNGCSGGSGVVIIRYLTPTLTSQTISAPSLEITASSSVDIGTSTLNAATLTIQSLFAIPSLWISQTINNVFYSVIVKLDQAAHWITGGPTPSFGSCGSGPVFIGAANDRNMTVQPGTGVLSNCSVNWNSSYSSNQTVVCSYTQITGTPVALVASTTQSGVVVSGATFTGDRFSLHCEATQ